MIHTRLGELLQSTRNSVNGVIEKLHNGSVHFFVGRFFFWVGSGGNIFPPMRIDAYLF